MQNLDPTYLRYIYDGLIKGSIHPENESELPEGLIGLYEESFEENVPLMHRQKLLQRFALFALLKKEVSISFVAEVLEVSENDILEFINTYASWFNSQESGKYQLYHERLKVYLLQKLSEKEILVIHEQLFTRLEKAMEEQQADEFERYALEFLGGHFYNNDNIQLYKISLNKTFQDRQILILGDFRATNKNLDLSLLAARREEDKAIILNISIERLRIRKRLHENLELIYNSIENNNFQLTSNLLSHFVGKKKGLVSLLFFYELFEGRLKTHPSKSTFIKLFLDHLSSEEDDLIQRGWILPVPDDAVELYIHELQNLELDDYHFRKLFEMVSQDDEYDDFNFNFDETESFNENYLDDWEIESSDTESQSGIKDTEFNDLKFPDSDFIENPFETMNDEEKAALKEFLNSIGEEDFESDLLDNDKDDDGKINIPFEERKNELINELIESKNRSADLKRFTFELQKNKNSSVSFKSELSFQLLLPILNNIPPSEFKYLFIQILDELKNRKLQSNPILFSHEVVACSEILIEFRLFIEVIELIEMNCQADMRDDLYGTILKSSYFYDKKLYVNILKSACRIFKTDVSVHINKGALVREFILNNNLQGLEDVLNSSDGLFKSLICASILEDEQLFNKISADEKSLKFWIRTFEQAILPELKGYTYILNILFDWKFSENRISEKEKENLTLHIIKSHGKERLKKILFCLKLFSRNDDIILLISECLKVIIEKNEFFISEFLFEKDEQIHLFKVILNCWKSLTDKSKEIFQLFFNQIYTLTKNLELSERTACAFIINKEIVLIDNIFFEKSLENEIPLILLKNDYVEEALEALQLCTEPTSLILQFEFWFEALERGNQKDYIQNLDNLITNEFENLARDISIEYQSLSCIPLIARFLNKLYELEMLDMINTVNEKVLRFIESLPCSKNEKRKILFTLTNTIDVKVFKTILYSASDSQRQLLAGSLSHFKGFSQNIQDKIYEELCVIGQDIELVESALIHLIKCDLFFCNDHNSLKATKDLFDFDYWLHLKSSN